MVFMPRDRNNLGSQEGQAFKDALIGNFPKGPFSLRISATFTSAGERSWVFVPLLMISWRAHAGGSGRTQLPELG